MDNIKLENTIKAQKIPFDQAVEKKLAYLKSDDVFSSDGDEYISVFKNLISSEKINREEGELAAAFQSLISSPETKSMTQNVGVSGSTHQVEPHRRTDEHKMTIAERIAALRGAINVPPEYRRS